MRRIALTVAALIALAGAAVAMAQAPPLETRLVTCETGPEPADRYAVFSGSMPAYGGATSMAMRFDLYQRTPGKRFRRVTLARWGVWERTSQAGVPGFIFTKRVEQLVAPAAFRAVVRYRWYDASGRRVHAARRRSAVCRQPDPRPNLRIGHVTLPRRGGATRVVVVNRGRSDAGAFAITAGRSDLVVRRTVAGLPAGERTVVSLRLGRCTPGEPIIVTLDPDGLVDERVESDNTLRLVCPQG